jgi:hypothetical protein
MPRYSGQSEPPRLPLKRRYPQILLQTSAPAAPIPPGQRRNRTLMFITGVTDIRGFLVWLRSRCPKSLTAQMKGEKLTMVPETADDFRAAVSALTSLDASKGVTFHPFLLPEDRCARLLIKNLDRRMPEDVVREELGALGICVQGIMQLRSGCRDQKPEKDRPVTPHFIVTVARGPEVTKIRSITQLCGLRVTVKTYTAPRGPLQCKRFGHTHRNCGYAPRCVACGETHNSGECSTPKERLKCCGGNHTANYRGCGKWKEAKAAIARRAPEGPVMRSGAHSGEVRKAPTQPLPSAEQLSLGDGWNHVLRGGRVAKAQPARPPKPTRTKVTAAPKKAPVKSTSKKAKSKKPAPKVSAAPKRAPTTKASTKECVAKPALPKQLVPPVTPSPAEISYLLDTLPINACVEVTRRLLRTFPSLPPGPAQSRAVLKTVILFVAKYGSTA